MDLDCPPLSNLSLAGREYVKIRNGGKFVFPLIAYDHIFLLTVIMF